VSRLDIRARGNLEKNPINANNVVSFEREGTRNFYQMDELGSTMYLTGTDGAAYNPYITMIGSMSYLVRRIVEKDVLVF
jgi:hypothetical protein